MNQHPIMFVAKVYMQSQYTMHDMGFKKWPIRSFNFFKTIWKIYELQEESTNLTKKDYLVTWPPFYDSWNCKTKKVAK